ncbi:MAG: DUF1634 domain-containing protein [Chthoniobacteraceae bacterium]|nr:DUF1634 domain-containing protein [Chthoniobacteraceae bacterium]
MNTDTSPTSLRVERIISNLLRWGVFVSLILLTAGTALCFIRSGDYGCAGGTAADFQRLLTEHHTPLPPLHDTLQGLLQFQGGAILLCGLILLIATPVLRVAISIVAFACEKDRAFVAITTVVLLLLILSFVLGKAG